MKKVGIIMLALALAAGGVWYFYRPAGGPAGEPWAEKLLTSSRIPAGKGALTTGGKFVPPQGAEAQQPVTRAEAEGKLQEALKVEELGGGKFRVGRVSFDKSERRVSLPAKVNMRAGVVEYVLTTEAGKKHEALLTSAASPQDLHLACLLLGMKGAPLAGENGEAMTVAAADAVQVSVSWETNGPPAVHPLASLISLTKGDPGQPGEPMPAGAWHYTGSRFTGPGAFAAQAEGTFISLIRDGSALLNNPGGSRDNDDLHMPNAALLPPEGTPVTLILQLPNAN
jgi:hypothetical protein